MDLARIRARGRSQTAIAWATNPIRALLWRLLLPYHEQMVDELEPRLLRHAAELDLRLQGLEAQLDATSERLRDDLTRTLSHQDVLSQVNTRFGGLRKDQAALSYRLAGMEDALRASANHTALHADLDAARQESAEADEALRKWVEALQTDALNAAEGLRSGLTEVQSVLHERLDHYAAEVRDLRGDVERFATQQAEVEAQRRALKEGVLRPGDKLIVDDSGLMITYGPAGRFLVRAGDLIGNIILSGQVWESHLRAAIERHSRPDGTAIDAGAYIGLHTVHLSRYFHQVFAFEPQEEIYRTLCANLVLNGCSNVHARREALYDGVPVMRLAPPENQEIPVPTVCGHVDYRTLSNAAALTYLPANGDEPGSVPARTVDSLALDNVSFIKVDAQGADLAILRGSQGTIERCRPVIAFEFERDLGAQHGAALEGFEAFFSACGYRLEMLSNTNPGLQADYLALPA